MNVSRIALLRYADILEATNIEPQYENKGLSITYDRLLSIYQNINDETDRISIECRSDGLITVIYRENSISSDRIKEVVNFLNDII